MSNICCRDASEQVLLSAFHSPYISNDKSPEDLVSSLPGKFVRIKVEGGIHATGVPTQLDDTETGLNRPKWMNQARCNSAKSVMSDYTQNTTTSTTSAIKSIVISPLSWTSSSTATPS